MQISCTPSSQKESDAPKKYDGLPSYLNWKEQENMEVALLRPFDYKENVLIIVLPQKNIVLFERKSGSNVEKSVFDVYDMQLPDDQNDRNLVIFRQRWYTHSENFNYIMSCFSNPFLFKETIEIEKNNSDIVKEVIQYFCLDDLNIIDDWTKIHIEKKLSDLSASVDNVERKTIFHYEYIDDRTPAKKINESCYFKIR